MVKLLIHPIHFPFILLLIALADECALGLLLGDDLQAGDGVGVVDGFGVVRMMIE